MWLLGVQVYLFVYHLVLHFNQKPKTWWNNFSLNLQKLRVSNAKCYVKSLGCAWNTFSVLWPLNNKNQSSIEQNLDPKDKICHHLCQILQVIMSAAALLLSLELQPCIISNSGVWKENSSPLTTVVGWKLTFKSLPPSHLLAERSQCACSKYNKVICLVANFSFFRGNNFGKLVIAMRVSYNILFSSTVNINPPFL